MIIDTIDNIGTYESLGSNFRTAVHFITSTDFETLSPGRIEVEGDRVYAIITEKRLTEWPENWEVHERYADIQIILDGSETIGYVPLNRLAMSVEFPKDKDAVLLPGLQGVDIPLAKGQFVIALPQDVHRPNGPGKDGDYAKKVIVKVLLEG